MQMKKSKGLLIITTLVCLLPIAVSVAVYQELPNQIAIHFDNSGNPDSYLPKAVAAFGVPVLLAAVHVFSVMMKRNDPRREGHPAVVGLTAWLVPMLSVVMVPAMLFLSMGARIPLHIILPAVIGVLIAVAGNYLPKCKRNYTVGIKLPWTLESEENWNKTHHFAGILWLAGGLVMLVSSLVLPNYWMIPLIMIALLVVAPIVYSYFLYKRNSAKEN